MGTTQTFSAIREEIAQVETTVTNKMLAKIEPSINEIRNEINTNMCNEMKNLGKNIQSSVCTDLRRLVREELELQNLKGAKNLADEDSPPSEEPGNSNDT